MKKCQVVMVKKAGVWKLTCKACGRRGYSRNGMRLHYRHGADKRPVL